MSTESFTSENGGGVENSPPAISGPHYGTNKYGNRDHVFWRCENCGLESTDASLRDGCFRYGVGQEREVSR